MEFKKAKKINLINEETGKTWKMKGVVNEDNPNEYFNTVSDGYNIVQHQEVVDIVEEAMQDKNFNPHTKIEPLNDGARIHIELTFPEVTLDVENNGQQVSLRCTYDNSYDGSTGLRLEVGAKSPYKDGFLWVGGLVRALEDNYYHRHTKGVNVAEFEKKLDKGIESFQTKIKDHFKRMFKTPVTSQAVIAYLDGAVEAKGITKKYVEVIREEVNKSSISNKWQLYCLICDTISSEAGSIDVRDRQLSLLVSRLHRKIKSKEESTDSPSGNSDGGESKKIVDLPATHLSTEELIGFPQKIEATTKDGFSYEKTRVVPIKLSIKKIGKKQFQVKQGDTVLNTFKKQKQAAKFIQRAA